MILDASAVLAILLEQPGSDSLIARIAAAPLLGIGAPTLLEAATVLSSRLSRDPRPLLSELLREGEIEVIPFTREHCEVAIDAFERYGKGRHPAALNFGDCQSYACAKVAGMPLLFAGNDFSQTDVLSA